MCSREVSFCVFVCCHEESNSLFSTISGSVHRSDNNLLESSKEKFAVKDLIIHEQFDPKTLENDIALVKLSQNVAFSKIIQPVCLPTYSADAPGYMLGKTHSQIGLLCSSDVLFAFVFCINQDFYKHRMAEMTHSFSRKTMNTPASPNP